MRCLILGAGAFGRRALHSLNPEYNDITVVDKEQPVLDGLKGFRARLVREDAVAFLAGSKPGDFDWIIPALPVHLAFRWLLYVLEREGIRCRPLPVPQGLAVPNTYYNSGTLYTSLAEHTCPPDCPEPDGYCYLTGGERLVPLHSLLSDLSLPGCAVEVVRSHQLAPGVGGIRPERLAALYRAARVAGRNLLVATACGCHGVLDMVGFT